MVAETTQFPDRDVICPSCAETLVIPVSFLVYDRYQCYKCGQQFDLGDIVNRIGGWNAHKASASAERLDAWRNELAVAEGLERKLAAIDALSPEHTASRMHPPAEALAPREGPAVCIHNRDIEGECHECDVAGMFREAVLGLAYLEMDSGRWPDGLAYAGSDFKRLIDDAAYAVMGLTKVWLKNRGGA